MGNSATDESPPELCDDDVPFDESLSGNPASEPPAPCALQMKSTPQAAPVAFSLDPIQQQAVALAVAKPPGCGIITGGPGTGKSTCLRHALDRLDSEQCSYELASPTGKAAKRMSEATGRPARTIHRLLEYKPYEGGFARNENSPLECDSVIIDEASMVDIELFAALMRAINPQHTRLTLVGDADQLPSVGPGRVLADVVESGRVPIVRLQTVHRSARDSWIYANAPKILRGKTPDLAPCNDFRFERADEARDIPGIVTRILTKELPHESDVQVLSPQSTGKAGTGALNHALQEALNPGRGGPSMPRGDHELRVGDRVIQTKNNYTLEVFNGELGTIVSCESSRLLVDFGDREIEYDLQDANALQLAYALTVHRSQGSEFDWAVIICHSTHTHMLTRQLIYTAVTRAKHGVVIVGNDKGLRVALSSKSMHRRNTGLLERLNDD